MTDAPETASLPETGSALVIAVHENPGIVLLDEARFERFYEAVKDEVSRLVPDLTTAKGRDEIKSMAFKVTKTKTAIDAAGKALKEEAAKRVQVVDKARRDIRERLEALAVEVRAPLTEWEVREQLRIEKAEGLMTSLRTDAIVSTEDTAEQIIERLERLEALVLDETVMADRMEDAEGLRLAAITTLEAVLKRIQQEERDRAELEALRAAKAEQERKQAERQAAYEAAKAAQREAAEAEARRLEYVERIMQHITDAGRGFIGGQSYGYPILIRELEEKVTCEPNLEPDWPKIDAHRLATLEAVRKAYELERKQDAEKAEAAERERVANAAREAAEQAEARTRAEAAAAAAQQAEEHARALAAEKRRADEAEAARRAEEEQAEANRKADEARAADQAHRGEIMTAAKLALMNVGLMEANAKAVVLAIAAGEIPAVSIRF